jgi:serine/threonine protein kinase
VQETHSDSKLPNIQSSRYRIISVLGAGAVGTVFKAHDSTLDKTVAIKTLNRTASDEEAIRFHREAKLAGTLNHPNVLSVLDFGLTEDDRPYLVLNYVQGVTLSDQISERGAIPAEEALSLFIQLTKGLIHAHSKNVIHRDIKPSNVMMLRSDAGTETATLVDFGLAKTINEQQELTRSGVGVGTPIYMSPEQIRGQQLDERTDIYSLGCLMYEVLTGLKPFKTDQLIELIELKLHHLPEAVSEIAPYEVPQKLSDIVDKCMERDRELRFSAASDLLAALESLSVRDASELHTALPDRVQSLTRNGAPFVLTWQVAIIICVGVISLLVPVLMITMLAPAPDEDPKKVDQMRRLDKFKNGRFINSYVGARVDDDDLIAFIRTHPGTIDSLVLWKPSITSRSLEFLENEKLRDLSFKESQRPIDADFLRSLSKIKSLQILRFKRNDFVSFESFHFFNGGGLSELEFDEQELAPDALEGIAKVKNIKRLQMQRLTGLKGNRLRTLHPMINLRELLLSTTDTDDEAVKAIVDSKVPIRKLNCDLTEIGPKSLELALQMPYLGEISVVSLARLKQEHVDQFHKTRRHQFEICWKPKSWMPNSDKSVP